MLDGRFSALPYHTKILLYGAVVGTISLGLASLAFVIQDQVSYRESFARENRSKAELLVRTVASAVGFRDPEFANRVLAGLSASPEVSAAAIYLEDGHLLARYRHQNGGPVPEAPPPTDGFQAGHLEIVQTITFQGLEVGTFYLRAKPPSRWGRIGRFGLLVVGIAVVALLISLWLSRFFNRTLIRPIAELEATATRVNTNGDVTARARKFSDDELGRLTDTFNAMLARVQERESELVASEERFSGLLDRLGEAVFRMTVPDGICEYCSPAAREVFGYDAAEFLQRPGILRDIVHPDSRDYIEQEHRRLVAGRAARVWEYKITDPEGQDRWILQTNAFQLDEFGRVQALEGCCTDITQRRQASAEKRRLELELQQAHKLEALGTLAGGIAHDFNNILEAVLGYTELSAMDLPDDHPVQEFLRQIKHAGRRAAGMVRKILTFSRHTEVGRSAVQLSHVVGEALDLVRPSLPQGVTVEASLPADLAPALADANQVHQIVMNLCTNAGHAMEESGGTLSVITSQVRLPAGHTDLTEEMEPGNHLQLLIADTGTGIDPAIRDRIFEPFFTTKPPGKGTGMGLSMVYGIVLDHGGNIVLDSIPGHGTTFRILLPVATEPVATHRDMEEGPVTGSGRVLFIDDEEMLVNLVQRVLGSLGYEVVGLTDAKQALALFQSAPRDFDIVVTDMTMPALSGLDIARGVLALRPDLPVIICSGDVRQDAQQQADALGVFAFASKPLTVERLGKLIHRALITSKLPTRRG